jgi:membrane associated rhomboid family serine protease
MLTPPRLSEFPRYPVIGGTLLLAAGVTIAKWSGFNVTPLLATAALRHGQWWRLVTDILPHGDVLHLAFNLYWMWVFGAVIEEAFGHLKTAALLLLFAIGASALQYGFLDSGIGLSGVGYGFFGLLWMLSKYDRQFQDAIDPRTVQLFLIWFVFCIITTVTNILPVANLAHAGGLILGVLAGLAIGRPEKRAFYAAATALAFAVMVWTAMAGRPLVNLSGHGGYEEAHFGVQALNARQSQEAVRWLEDATRYQPRNAGFWQLLAVAEEQSGNHQAALAAIDRAQRLQPQPGTQP